MKCISVKFVPKLLTVEQKETWLAVCWSRFKPHEHINYQWWILGLWVWPKTEAQTSQWKTVGSWRPKKTHQVWSKVKVMLKVFFDREGIIHHKYALDGQTFIKEYYVEVICQLCVAVRCQVPVSWKWGDWQLHHEYAPAHSSHLVQTCLAKHWIPQVPQSPIHQTCPCVTFSIPKGENTVEGE
jgi:hypothetical protein